MDIVNLLNGACDLFVQFVDFGLNYFSPIELVIVTALFLYALQLTVSGKIIETLVKTAVGYIVYMNADFIYQMLNITSPWIIIGVKTFSGMVAVWTSKGVFNYFRPKS